MVEIPGWGGGEMNVSGHERIAGLCQWLVFAFFFKGDQFVFSEISEPMIFRIF